MGFRRGDAACHRFDDLRYRHRPLGPMRRYGHSSVFVFITPHMSHDDARSGTIHIGEDPRTRFVRDNDQHLRDIPDDFLTPVSH